MGQSCCGQASHQGQMPKSRQKKGGDVSNLSGTFNQESSYMDEQSRGISDSSTTGDKSAAAMRAAIFEQKRKEKALRGVSRDGYIDIKAKEDRVAEAAALKLEKGEKTNMKWGKAN